MARRKARCEGGRAGLKELKEAVRLNPDAHFGRERVQIALVGELLHPSGHMEADVAPLQAAEGYAGIVRLGAGWESPDVFRAMAINLASPFLRPKRLGAVASLALLRADELMEKGHPAHLKDDVDFKMVEGAQTPSLAADTREEFALLRREADDWEVRRNAFMMSRLKVGRHPDTDPAFWQGWTDVTPPPIRHRWILDTFGVPIPWYVVTLGFLLASALVSLPLLYVYFAVRAVIHWTARRRAV